MSMKLKEIRSAKGLTQKTVADYLGCSSVVYSRYENGVREPSVEMLNKIADYFDTSVDYIVGRKEKNPRILSDDEEELLDAARRADERAREDALKLLERHQVSR